MTMEPTAAGTRPLDYTEAALLPPEELRTAIAAGRWTTPTVGLAPGYVQANLIIVPRDAAFDFLLFCTRNPKPCPLIEVTEPGDPILRVAAAGADLRTAIPRYRVFENGRVVAEPSDITDHWRDDSVGFLFGCSLTFEEALQKAEVPLRHLDAGRQPAVYITSRDCAPAGRFAGPMVVTMRPVPAPLVTTAVEVTGRYPLGHGAPVHVGDPASLGVASLDAVDFGEPPVMQPGDVPVFWACGVTPQLALAAAAPPHALSHYPACMFVTDEPSDRRVAV